MLSASFLVFFFGLVSSDLAPFRKYIPNISNIDAYAGWVGSFRSDFERINDQELLDVLSSCSCARCPEEDRDIGRATLLSQISPSFVANKRRIEKLLNTSKNLSSEVQAAFRAYLDDGIRVQVSAAGIGRIHQFANQSPASLETVEGVVQFLADPSNIPSGGYLGPAVYEGRSYMVYGVELGNYMDKRLFDSLLEFYAGKVSESQSRTIIFRDGHFDHETITYCPIRPGEQRSMHIKQIQIAPGTVFCSLWANDYGPRLYCVNREDASGRPKFILFDNIDEFKKLNNQSSYLGHSKFISKLQVVSIEDPNDRFKESDVQVVPIPVPLCPKVSDEDALLPENVSCHNQCYIGALMAFKSYVLKKPPPKGIKQWEKEWKTMLAELMTGKMIDIDVALPSAVQTETPTTTENGSATEVHPEDYLKTVVPPTSKVTQSSGSPTSGAKEKASSKAKTAQHSKTIVIGAISIIMIIAVVSIIIVLHGRKRIF